MGSLEPRRGDSGRSSQGERTCLDLRFCSVRPSAQREPCAGAGEGCSEGCSGFARAPRELRRDGLPGVGDERRRPTLKYSLSRRSGEAAKAEYLTDSAIQDLSGHRQSRVPPSQAFRDHSNLMLARSMRQQHG